eukprot:gene9522-11200_t
MARFQAILQLLIVYATTCVVFASVAKSAGTEWYYNNWCGAGHEYLSDSKCAKLFPNVLNREWTCGVPSKSAPSTNSGFQRDTILADVSVDTTELTSVVTDPDVNLCVILTQRVADASAPAGVTLYNKYLCAGEYSASVAYEPWSSTKVFAMANAAGHLRTNETQCGAGDLHNHKFGLDGSVTGKHGPTQLADLATVICSYDTTAGYSSNSLSSYFHDIGWRGRINDLVQNWLLVNQKNDAEQTLGGNYGEATPSDLTLDVTSSTASSSSATTCPADKDPWPIKFPNYLSALSAGELVRRIALHREIPKGLKFPGAEWADMQNILYGAANSTLFPGQVWGGMTADTAIYTQSGVDLSNLLSNWDQDNNSQWRVFSKLGAGYSSDRSRGEIVSNAYTCLPRYEAGSSTAVGGIEFTIAARSSVAQDSSLNKAEDKLHAAMDKALQYVMAHYAV